MRMMIYYRLLLRIVSKRLTIDNVDSASIIIARLSTLTMTKRLSTVTILSRSVSIVQFPFIPYDYYSRLVMIAYFVG